MDGHGHGPLDFHASTKYSFNLQVPVIEGLKLVEDSIEPMLVYNSILANGEEEVSRWARIREDGKYTKYDI